MRRLIAILVAFQVASCAALDPYYIKECEQSLVRTLKSPSSYKRISTFAWNDDISAKKLQSTYFGPDLLLHQAQMLEEIGNKKIQLRRVSIQYDAENSYSAAIRDTKYCSFIQVDNAAYKPSPVYQKKWEEHIGSIGKDSPTKTVKNHLYAEPDNSSHDAADPFAGVSDCCMP